MSGKAMPKSIAEAPNLLIGLGLYRDGYKDLCSERTANGEIPWSAINHYTKELELSGDQTESMHYLIVAMDEAFREYTKSKENKNKGK